MSAREMDVQKLLDLDGLHTTTTIAEGTQRVADLAKLTHLVALGTLKYLEEFRVDPDPQDLVVIADLMSVLDTASAAVAYLTTPPDDRPRGRKPVVSAQPAGGA